MIDVKWVNWLSPRGLTWNNPRDEKLLPDASAIEHCGSAPRGSSVAVERKLERASVESATSSEVPNRERRCSICPTPPSSNVHSRITGPKKSFRDELPIVGFAFFREVARHASRGRRSSSSRRLRRMTREPDHRRFPPVRSSADRGPGEERGQLPGEYIVVRLLLSVTRRTR